MADGSAQERIPNRLISHAYTPVCPVHGRPMVPYAWGLKLVYFRCEHTWRGTRYCDRTDKSPRVVFSPVTDRSN